MRHIGFLSLIVMSLVFALVSCTTTTNPAVQLAETQNQITTAEETIHVNNCGGKANSTQTAEHSFSTNIEGGITGKFGPDFLQGSVSAHYGQYRNTSKKQELIAAPGTNMEYVLKWTEQTWIGTLTDNSSSGTYKAQVPISVEQVSSQDLGCPPPTASTGQSDGGNAAEAPTAHLPPTPIPTAYVPPTSVPTEAPVQDTPDGTILEPGMAWYKNGKSILLNNYNLTSYAVANSEAVNAEWIVKNVSTHNISIKFTEDNFKASNNIGQGVTYKRFYDLPNGNGSTVSFAPSASLKFSIDLWIAYSDPSVNMVTISVSLSDIQNARWNIPVYH